MLPVAQVKSASRAAGVAVAVVAAARATSKAKAAVAATPKVATLNLRGLRF